MKKTDVKDKLKIIVDKCVVCGAKTEYLSDTPVCKRKYYIEGAGQMCSNCFKEVYCGESVKYDSFID